jgi:hypothetical protein
MKRKLRIAWSCGRVPGHEHATYEDALHCSGTAAAGWDPAVDVLEAANLRLAKRLAPKNPHEAVRRVRVYGGNLGGRWRAILACHSFAEFNRATHISRDFACETHSAEEITQAMTAPGRLFIRAYGGAEKANPWLEHERYD